MERKRANITHEQHHGASEDQRAERADRSRGRRLDMRKGLVASAVIGGAAILGVAPASARASAVREAPRAQPQVIPAQTASDVPVLARGMITPGVSAWQERLNEWRDRTGQTGITVDGIFGSVTEDATRNFQAAAGIAVDGVVGPETRAAMDGALGAPAPAPPPPPAEVPAEDPFLHPGAVGAPVADWQARLNEWRDRIGLEAIAVDGVYGTVTENATRNLQAATNIAVDGIVGPQTRGALDDALAAPADQADTGPVLDRGDTGQAVADWQARLNEWRTRTGMGTIGVDGVFGPVTEAATREFQAAAGIGVDGVVGPNTRAALGAALT